MLGQLVFDIPSLPQKFNQQDDFAIISNTISTKIIKSELTNWTSKAMIDIIIEKIKLIY